MFQIIRDIYNAPIGQHLGFKGGTLAFFMYELDRFSTDLDFDLLAPDPTESILEELIPIVSKHGSIKNTYNKRFTYFLLLDYGDEHRNIKIEISKKSHQLDSYETINFFGTPIIAMTQAAMFANKFLALASRWKNRDLYDIRFFFEHHFPIDIKLLEAKSNKDYLSFLRDIQQKLPKQYTPNTLLAELGDLVTQKQKQFIKSQLLDAVLGWLAWEIAERGKKSQDPRAKSQEKRYSV